MLLDITGWLGMAFVLVAYWRSMDPLHALGSLLLGFYSVWHHTWPQAITNAMWCALSLRKMRRQAPERTEADACDGNTIEQTRTLAR